MLTFHLSFIIILIGAGVTRYVSFEGLMIINEGTSSDFIFTSDPYLLVYLENPKTKSTKIDASKKYFSVITDNYFKNEVAIDNKNFTFEYVNFQTKMKDTFVVNKRFKTSALELVTDGMQSNFLCENEVFMVGNIPLSFNKTLATPGIETRLVGDSVQIKTMLPVRYLPMTEMQKARQSGQPVPDEMFTAVPADSIVPFYTTTLYQVNNQQIVFKQAVPHAKMMLMPSGHPILLNLNPLNLNAMKQKAPLNPLKNSSQLVEDPKWEPPLKNSHDSVSNASTSAKAENMKLVTTTTLSLTRKIFMLNKNLLVIGATTIINGNMLKKTINGPSFSYAALTIQM
jgi:hypothetical protein